MRNLKTKIEDYLISSSGRMKINSKDIQKGDVFIALKGSKNHGNIYIADSLKKGARYIITDKNLGKKVKNLLKVDNTKKFLLKLSLKKRNLFKGKTVAITGSLGKTTTKELLKYFLSSQLKISTSIKSYNNYLGLLISIINQDNMSVISVFEIGISNFKEMAKLSRLLKPEHVVITNIEPTHLEKLKNTRNIAIEKSKLIDPKYNPNIELVVLRNYNKDELFIIKLAKIYNIPEIITYGTKKNSQYRINKIKKIKNYFSQVTFQNVDRRISFQTSTSMNHQIYNILIAFIFIIKNHLSISLFISQSLFLPLIDGRGLIHNIILNRNKIKLIDESYNSSPVSMKNCINYFDKFHIEKNKKKIIIIGEMLELGTKSNSFHREILLEAIKSSIKIIVFCGDPFKKIIKTVKLDKKRVHFISDEYKIIDFLNDKVLKNDIILAKGSNSSKINKLVSLLLEKKER